MGTRIDDKAIAESIEAEVKKEVAGLPSPPVLASLEPAATPEAPMIEAACRRVGIECRRLKASAASIQSLIEQANGDEAVSGILVNGIRSVADPEHWRELIAPEKDVAGAGRCHA